MQLKIGANLYSFATNSVEPVHRTQWRWNQGGQALAQTISLDLSGWLLGTDTASLTLAMSALKTALSIQGQDVILYDDNAAATQIGLVNATSASGVRTVKGPDFPEARGALVNQVRFECGWEAVYEFTSAALLLVSWTETLAFSGGGAVYAIQPAVEGPPLRVKLYDQTGYRCVQSGEVVGFKKYPNAPAQKFPGALSRSPDVQERSPRRMGRLGQYEEFPVSYRYEFESVSPLIATPSLWV